MASPGWSKDNVAVVSGANRGFALEIVRSLAEQGLTVVLTARDETKGKAAVDELQGKGLKSVVFHQLDPTDTKSVESLATWLKTEYGGFDILYLADMKAGRTEAEGWVLNKAGQGPIYAESKMFLNVYVSALAKSFAKTRTEGNEIFVAGICPGATLTDILKASIAEGFVVPEGFPVNSPAEGAETAVWLALLPKSEWQGKSGRLFAEKTEYPFGWKNPPL